jgi:hypothetical protein
MRPSSYILLFGGALSEGSLLVGTDILKPPPIGPILTVNLFCTLTRERVQSEWK